MCTSGKWVIARNVPKTQGKGKSEICRHCFTRKNFLSSTVTWNVGRESATPIQAGDVCTAFVEDEGYTGASGLSQNVTGKLHTVNVLY